MSIPMNPVSSNFCSLLYGRRDQFSTVWISGLSAHICNAGFGAQFRVPDTVSSTDTQNTMLHWPLVNFESGFMSLWELRHGLKILNLWRTMYFAYCHETTADVPWRSARCAGFSLFLIHLSLQNYSCICMQAPVFADRLFTAISQLLNGLPVIIPVYRITVRGEKFLSNH